jgi:hypothetical protein
VPGTHDPAEGVDDVTVVLPPLKLLIVLKVMPDSLYVTGYATLPEPAGAMIVI